MFAARAALLHDEVPPFFARYMSLSRKPWSMKWVALIIILVLGPYTFLRWHYRKPEPAFEPYHDIKDRANTIRLLSAGFNRVTLPVDRPADPSQPMQPVATTTLPGGLPSALDSTLVDRPVLPATIGSVEAAAETNTLFPYAIEFSCGLADNHQQLGDVYLYLREDQLFVVPATEPLTDELLSRNRQGRYRVTIPAGVLKPGNYEIALISAQTSQAWSLLVK